jgi:hypothetical protein
MRVRNKAFEKENIFKGLLFFIKVFTPKGRYIYRKLEKGKLFERIGRKTTGQNPN